MNTRRTVLPDQAWRWFLPLLLATCLSGCAHNMLLVPREASHALVDTGDTRLGRAADSALAGSAATDSALHLLPDGRQALAARLALIERAQRSLDVQYYIWRADASGHLLAEALWKAAARGVRVRILLDDWGSRPSDAELAQLSAHANIEVRLFNPLSRRWSLPVALLLDFDRGNRRMHNKALIADNRAAIVGGRNVGDEYFEAGSEVVFSDLDALVMGPVVPQVSQGFDRYWNSAYALAVGRAAGSEPAAQASAPAQDAGASLADFGRRLDLGQLGFNRGRAIALYDDPSKLEPGGADRRGSDLGRQIAAVVGAPTQEVFLVSAYFVPGSGGTEQLRDFRRRGVRVVVVTNSLAATDVPAVYAGYARYRKPLLEEGVELYEIRVDPQASPRSRRIERPGSSRVSLHAKLMVVDRRSTFIGSMNIDPRSLVLNTENGIVVESPAIAAAIVDGTQRLLAGSAYRLTQDGGNVRWHTPGQETETVLDSAPGASWWRRFSSWMLSWLDIEEWL